MAYLTKDELIDRSRTARAVTTGIIGAPAQTTILAGIPAGKRVCIWKITATIAGVGAGAETLQIASCAAGAGLETNIHGQWGFGTLGQDTLQVGGDIESPVLIIPNATPAAGASGNVDIVIANLLLFAFLDVTISYYLLP